ncbi:hypothetical protein H4W32_007821 [Actinophytocola algeriensis]|uniref:Uncharacterized protein n=1 Tax=Actinophytocola algeriensis TaxID=1768010 RepID=A0A7W7Q6A8_9PSEU|nr:hypothetical protein [Actinophytocola algeriensis]MBE1479779.1 hypothetical protein [Actinophytocola algeriensis]
MAAGALGTSNGAVAMKGSFVTLGVTKGSFIAARGGVS